MHDLTVVGLRPGQVTLHEPEGVPASISKRGDDRCRYDRPVTSRRCPGCSATAISGHAPPRQPDDAICPLMPFPSNPSPETLHAAK